VADANVPSTRTADIASPAASLTNRSGIDFVSGMQVMETFFAPTREALALDLLTM
jgi:hypothetical protein